MFMPVVIRRSQLMVHTQGGGKGHERQQQQNEGLDAQGCGQTTKPVRAKHDHGNHRGAGR